MGIKYTTDDIDATDITPEWIGDIRTWRIWVEDDENPNSSGKGTYVGELVSCFNAYPERILTFRDGFKIYTSFF